MKQRENQLEKVLWLAYKDPELRPKFYRLLLDSKVYVLEQEHIDEGQNPIEHDSIQIPTWRNHHGEPHVPFFTSIEALQEVATTTATTARRVPARQLFEMTLGYTLVLNPGHNNQKVFSAQEIQDLLNGTLTESKLVSRRTQSGESIWVVSLEDYPALMIDALTQYFSTCDRVQEAYLAWTTDGTSHDTPHYLVGILPDRVTDLEPIVNKIGGITKDTEPNGIPVDVLIIDAIHGQLSKYLLDQAEPFYRHVWGSRLKIMPDDGGQASGHLH